MSCESRLPGIPAAFRSGMTGRLMIVDDEEPILFSVHDYFTLHGWAVDCAREIGQAAAMASANDYDAIITDLHFTGIQRAEGLELVQHLRSSSLAKVIVFTAWGTSELERAAFDCGAHAFVQKTVPIAHIAKLLTTLAGSPSRCAE